MAQAPAANVGLSETGGAVSTGSQTLILCHPAPNGGPLYAPRLYTSVAGHQSDFGVCEGDDFVGQYIDATGQSIVCVGMTPIAGTVGAMVTSTVTGNAVASVAGTPTDKAALQVLIGTGGALGTAGIVFQVSVDGGETYGPSIRLGANLTYSPPNSGLTITFGTSAATYNAGDLFSCPVHAPTYDTTGIAAVEACLAAAQYKARCVLFIGDANATTAQNLSDTANDYFTAKKRDTRFFGCLRAILDPALKTGAATLTFAASGETITRSTGSFITDGFAVGMSVTVSNSTSNNAVVNQVITALSATVMTLAGATLVNESGSSSVVLSGQETEQEWMAALDVITSGKLWPRLSLGGGHLMRTSPIDQARRKRNVQWATLMRYMAHDVQVSPAEVDLGRLDGWSMYSKNGNALVVHDERVNGGLLNSRLTCATSLDGDPGGAYVALALTLDTDNAPMSRVPIACVADVCTGLCRVLTTQKLNSNVVSDPKTGFPLETEYRRIELAINKQLQSQLTTPKLEGQRASAVVFTLVRGTDLRQPGAVQGWACKLTVLGYLEQLSGTVTVQGAAS